MNRSTTTVFGLAALAMLASGCSGDATAKAEVSAALDQQIQAALPDLGFTTVTCPATPQEPGATATCTAGAANGSVTEVRATRSTAGNGEFSLFIADNELLTMSAVRDSVAGLAGVTADLVDCGPAARIPVDEGTTTTCTVTAADGLPRTFVATAHPTLTGVDVTAAASDPAPAGLSTSPSPSLSPSPTGSPTVSEPATLPGAPGNARAGRPAIPPVPDAPAKDNRGDGRPGPAPAKPAADADLRVMTFNVRTVRATSDKRSWLQRVPDVARTIVSENPGVVALQELGPGRADGTIGTTVGRVRQTDSLMPALARAGGGKYKIVRSTAYVRPGQRVGTQGARLVYDSSRYVLRSNCPQKTGTQFWSSSCNFGLSLGYGAKSTDRRYAAVAQFQDRRSGQRFFVVSVHFDSAHKASIEGRLEAARARQAQTAVNRVAALNPPRYPVIIAGDLNTWRSHDMGHSAFDALENAGYVDTLLAADTKVNAQYPTINHFRRTLTPGNARMDAIFVKGLRTALRWKNVMQVTDSTRPSDHNAVVADVRIG